LGGVGIGPPESMGVGAGAGAGVGVGALAHNISVLSVVRQASSPLLREVKRGLRLDSNK
jgi:hypothetical protein